MVAVMMPISMTRKVQVVPMAQLASGAEPTWQHQVQVVFEHRTRDNETDSIDTVTNVNVIVDQVNHTHGQRIATQLRMALDDAFAQGMSYERHIHQLGK